MGFWILRRKTETMEEKAARRARSAERDVHTYDAIMAAFVQPLPTFSQWPGQVGANQPPTYENIGHTTYYPATYYPNQSYEHPYGQQAYPYQSCPSSTGSLASSEVLPTYVDSTYNPYARQVPSPLEESRKLTDATVIDVLLAVTSVPYVWNILGIFTSIAKTKEKGDELG
jgi:hypothetical protein